MAESEPKAIPHDIRQNSLIRRGIVVKSQDPGTQFCHHPLPLILCVIAQLRSVEMVSRPLLNGSITQVFLLVDAESAACINVELPHKAAIIAIQLYICPGVALYDTLPAYAITQFASHVFSVNRPSLAIFPLPNPWSIIEADLPHLG